MAAQSDWLAWLLSGDRDTDVAVATECRRVLFCEECKCDPRGTIAFRDSATTVIMGSVEAQQPVCQLPLTFIKSCCRLVCERDQKAAKTAKKASSTSTTALDERVWDSKPPDALLEHARCVYKGMNPADTPLPLIRVLSKLFILYGLYMFPDYVEFVRDKCKNGERFNRFVADELPLLMDCFICHRHPSQLVVRGKTPGIFVDMIDFITRVSVFYRTGMLRVRGIGRCVQQYAVDIVNACKPLSV